MKGGREGGESSCLSQGRNLVVPFICQDDNEGDGFSFLLFPLCLSSFSKPRKRHKQREDEDEERGGRAGRVC